MEELVASSDLVTKEVIGKTYEGRDMVEITITEGTPGSKPVHWIDTNIHAREWITSASCMWFMNEVSTHASLLYIMLCCRIKSTGLQTYKEQVGAPAIQPLNG